MSYLSLRCLVVQRRLSFFSTKLFGASFYLSFRSAAKESAVAVDCSRIQPTPMRYTYHAEQWLPYPLELVFAFFANPQNLPHLMPLWQDARIEDATFVPPPPRPGTSGQANSIVAGVGTQLTMSFKPFPRAPFRIPWQAEITDF